VTQQLEVKWARSGTAARLAATGVSYTLYLLSAIPEANVGIKQPSEQLGVCTVKGSSASPVLVLVLVGKEAIIGPLDTPHYSTFRAAPDATQCSCKDTKQNCSS
jgi:hypothetical protein